ncbi:hypothetical protein F4809DRAFT_620725 [Biscogniauxia mediterranea]|nr:hypothetical protein F4809DRAFT_620725 [Biscogniauxia mediterranea]
MDYTEVYLRMCFISELAGAEAARAQPPSAAGLGRLIILILLLLLLLLHISRCCSLSPRYVPTAREDPRCPHPHPRPHPHPPYPCLRINFCPLADSFWSNHLFLSLSLSL